MSSHAVDPRICCAARVCCHDPIAAQEAAISLLEEMGIETSRAHDLLARMEMAGIVFMPMNLATAIADFVGTSARAVSTKEEKNKEKEIRKALDILAPPEPT